MSLPSNGSLTLSEINKAVRFTNGNVGLGTTTPDSKLHLYDSSVLALNLQSSTAQTKIWSFNDNKTYFQSLGDIEFTGIASATLRHLYLATSGNVGINTETPRVPLHIVGSSLLGTSSGDVIGANLFWNGTTWTRGNSSAIGFGLRIGSTGDAYGNGMQILTMDTTNGFANRMLVGANGNVGIGTTNPTQQLEIAGGRIRVSVSGPASAVYEMANSNGIAYLFNNPSGTVHLMSPGNRNIILGPDEFGTGTNTRVGIATNSPTSFANLHVNGDILLSTAGSLWITGIGDSASNRLRIQNNITQSNIDFMGGPLLFRGGSTLNTLFTITTSGNLGLGITPTNAKLTVNGTTDIYGTLQVGYSPTSFLINLGSTGVSGYRSAYIYGENAKDLFINNQQSGNFYIFANNGANGNQFVMSSTGNVGLGSIPGNHKFRIHSSAYPNVTLTTEDVSLNCIDFDSTSKTGGKLWRVAGTHQNSSAGQGKFIIYNVTNNRQDFAVSSLGYASIGTFTNANAGLHITNGTTGQFQLGPASSGGFHIESTSGELAYYTGDWGTGTYLGKWGSSLQVVGALSKGSGSFDIQHPLHPNDSNKRLVHSFIEGPRCDLIYRGQVTLINGTATVNLDTDCVAEQDCAMSAGTFEALCANPQFHLENENFSRVIGNIQGNILTIQCEDTTSTDTVYWTVIAERKDPFIKSWERTNPNGYLITEYTKTTSV